ncbi:MAG: hypothetical protein HC767_06710 [Akkermansiaceae bacterium]|nr:hypothetical protein [Akkermansiaceae bacterium]
MKPLFTIFAFTVSFTVYSFAQPADYLGIEAALTKVLEEAAKAKTEPDKKENPIEGLQTKIINYKRHK